MPPIAPTGSSQERLANWELLAGLAPFFFLSAYLLLGQWSLALPAGAWLPAFALGGMLISLLAVVILAPIRGWPRWALPGLGLLLAILFYLFLAEGSGLLQLELPRLLGWPSSNLGRVVSQAAQYLVSYLPLALVELGLLLLLGWLPPLRQLSRRARGDWSLVSFALYGLTFLPIMAPDDYVGRWPYQAAAMAILAGGAWAYLRQASAGRRVAALLAALWLALAAMSLGIYQLYPLQAWAAHTSFPRWWEAINPLLCGPALTVTLLAPAVLKLLPPARAPAG